MITVRFFPIPRTMNPSANFTSVWTHSPNLLMGMFLMIRRQEFYVRFKGPEESMYSLAHHKLLSHHS